MDIKSLWLGMSPPARRSLVISVLGVACLTLALAYWAFRGESAVLFSRLAAADAAALTRELDQQKIAYQLADEGATILVDAATVHQTRLKLMGKELPLHGAVGFELFNQSDFGATEFAQKINYQRALQGELARTIGSLAEVQTVRVHLALPEEGLFKRDPQKAKASITLALKNGQSLRREQVKGIQRLVAAAVAGIEPQQVTIVSEQGIALTPPSGEGELADSQVAAHASIDIKREVEAYLSQKANALLEKALGSGAALASVDVTLNLNQVKVTTEDVVSPRGASADAPTGVIVRQRETIKEGARVEGATHPQPTDTHRETEYQVGRRVEQVVGSPGGIQRLQVVAVLRTSVDPQTQEQIRQLLAGVVGIVRERGDQVVVQSIASVVAPHPVAPPSLVDSEDQRPRPASVATQASGHHEAFVQVLLALLAAVLGIAGWIWMRRRASSLAADRGQSDRNLTQPEREAELRRIQAWLRDAGADSSRTSTQGESP